MIFNRARDEKKTGGEAVMLSSPSKDLHAYGAPKSSVSPISTSWPRPC